MKKSITFSQTFVLHRKGQNWSSREFFILRENCSFKVLDNLVSKSHKLSSIRKMTGIESVLSVKDSS